jgi:Phosphotransferase enzyme family
VIGRARIADHLRQRYAIEIDGVSPLDAGVFRVACRERPDWVLRLFPPDRALEGVWGDAEVLASLQRAGFPAERCAHPEPVSLLAGHRVLVTEYVEPAVPLRPGRPAAILGAPLGRLHAAAAAGARRGGAWHHLPAANVRGRPAESVVGSVGGVVPRGARALFQSDIRHRGLKSPGRPAETGSVPVPWSGRISPANRRFQGR